jgi:hypothetical protein
MSAVLRKPTLGFSAVSAAMGHKRKPETSGQHRLWTIQLSHQAPIARVTTVSGIPARQYAQKEIWKPAARARSATIRFATEPTGVRLPAKVALIARRLRWLSETSTQQPVSGQTQKVGIAPRWLGDRRLKPTSFGNSRSRQLGQSRWLVPSHSVNSITVPSGSRM